MVKAVQMSKLETHHWDLTTIVSVIVEDLQTWCHKDIICNIAKYCLSYIQRAQGRKVFPIWNGVQLVVKNTKMMKTLIIHKALWMIPSMRIWM